MRCYKTFEFIIVVFATSYKKHILFGHWILLVDGIHETHLNQYQTTITGTLSERSYNSWTSLTSNVDIVSLYS
jgi:hypothetical protein